MRYSAIQLCHSAKSLHVSTILPCGSLCDPNKVLEALEQGTPGLNGRLCCADGPRNVRLRALGRLDKPEWIVLEYVDFSNKKAPINVIKWFKVPAFN